MPQRKYLLVQGVAGIPVSDPWAPIASPARYVGFRFKGGDPNPRSLSAMDYYEPIPQVIVDHPLLQKAASKGEITILARCIAWDADEALKQMTPKAPKPAAPSDKITKAPKGGDA
jgi:hypothetical protein